MMIQYKCCFCQKNYDWYDGIYENPNYDDDKARLAKRKGEEYEEKRGVFIKANGFTLNFIPPIDDSARNAEGIEPELADGNLGCLINICPDCMRKLLDNLHPFDEDNNAWYSV